MEVIIFDKSADSDLTGVGIITPAPNSGLTIEEVAAKDVPSGADFEIIDDATLPWETPREAWEWV